MYTNIYSGGYPSALDFDYRYKLRDALPSENLMLLLLYRRGYMFWSDTNSDRIYRAWINGTGATVLINSGLSNTCKIDMIDI